MRLLVSPVAPSGIPDVWTAAGPLLARALRHGRGEYEPHHVLARLLNGTWTLWVAVNEDTGTVLAVAATEIVFSEADVPPHLWIVMGAGSHAAECVAKLFVPIREYARGTGCSQMRFLGRPGWARSGAIPEEFRRTHDLWSAPVED